MVRYGDIPGITIHPVQPESGGTLRIEILPAMEPSGDATLEIDRLWEEMKQALPPASSLREGELERTQPRLFDGPILLADHCEMEWGRLVVRRESYKTLATAERVGADVYALGVQGLVIARDDDGDACVLLGRRSGEVRMYPGMWENAPSGSVPPPGENESSVGIEYLAKVLRDEGLEELGVDLDGSTLSCVALLEDRAARSIDVVLRVEASERVRSAMVGCRLQDCGAWEYAETAWSPIGDACAWAERDARGVSPPTRGLLRWLRDS